MRRLVAIDSETTAVASPEQSLRAALPPLKSNAITFDTVRQSMRVTMAVALMVALTGCGGGSEDVGGGPASDLSTDSSAVQQTEPPPTDPSTERTPASQDVNLLVESGFTTISQSDGRLLTTAGAVVTNPSADEAACGVTVSFNLVDGAGKVLDTETVGPMDWIPASGTAIVSSFLLGYDITAEPTTMNVFAVANAFIATPDLIGCENFDLTSGVTLEVADVTIDQSGLLEYVNGQVTNQTDQLVETAIVDCVVRAAGVIVGGEQSFVDPIPAGGTIAFSVESLEFIPDNADSADCWVRF